MPRTVAPQEALPKLLPPMLLRPGLPPAHSADWALEVKWDGMRAQLRVEQSGAWCLRSRPGRDCSERVPELEHLARDLAGHDVLLDGELVCLDAAGRPDFHRLRRRLSAKDTHSAARLASELPATLMLFDLLHLDGQATRALPYARRRVSLEHHLGPTGSCWRVPSQLSGALDDVLAVTRAHQLEGIVAKRLDAPYTPGRRTGAWLKHKHRRRETFAVTAWRSAGPRAPRPDAILLARANADGTLRPAGAAELGLRGEDAIAYAKRSRNGTWALAVAPIASPRASGSTSTSTAPTAAHCATRSCESSGSTQAPRAEPRWFCRSL